MDLFTTTPQELPALERARRRLDQAQDEYDKWERAKEELAVSTPIEVLTERANAMYHLKLAELDELQRLRK